jgi:ParB family transcriptional regulator, chromosome partitioning protein
MLDENRLAMVAKQRGIKKAKDSDSIGKLFVAYLCRAEENLLSGILLRPIRNAARARSGRQI